MNWIEVFHKDLIIWSYYLILWGKHCHVFDWACILISANTVGIVHSIANLNANFGHDNTARTAMVKSVWVPPFGGWHVAGTGRKHFLRDAVRSRLTTSVAIAIKTLMSNLVNLNRCMPEQLFADSDVLVHKRNRFNSCSNGGRGERAGSLCVMPYLDTHVWMWGSMASAYGICKSVTSVAILGETPVSLTRKLYIFII